MIKNPKRIFVISLLAISFILAVHARSFAGAGAGTVTHISGPLFAKKADGTTRILSKGSAVESGDIVVSEKGTYARIKFTDGSEMTLRPNTQIKISNYNYDQGKPKEDSAVYDLAKGGLRAVTGSIGKRGNQDSYKMNTPTATVGIRGTDWGALYCQNDCGGYHNSEGKTPANGLYLDVASGKIVVTNSQGSHEFSPGQFGFVSMGHPPVVLPKDPGTKFSPPPSFTSSSGPSKGGGTNTDCVVR